MFRVISTRYAMQDFLNQCSGSRGRDAGMNKSSSKCMRSVYAFAIGIIGSVATTKPARVFTADHGSSEHIQEVVNEILQHAIWHQIGHLVGLGNVAAGVLGGLLSFQSLGERDVFLISRQISKPLLTYHINPQTKRMEPCLELANGKRLIGQEIIDFHRELQWVQFIPDPTKRS